MSYSTYWNFVDELTVAEATALWCGVEPEIISQSTPTNIPNFRAIRRMLSEAIRSKKLPATLSPSAEIFDDYSSSRISRGNLRTWAKSIGELPAFLFDTLMDVSADELDLGETETPSASPVSGPLLKRLNNAPAAADIGQSAENASIEAGKTHPARPPASNTKRQGGRPRKHDWDGAVIHIIRIADTDGLPTQRSELTDMICEWFLSNYGLEPASSQVSGLVSRIYSDLENRGWGPQGSAPRPIPKTRKR
jgi:hypothetical protein